MNSSFSKYIMVILGGFLLSLPGFAEEAPEENPPIIKRRKRPRRKPPRSPRLKQKQKK